MSDLKDAEKTETNKGIKIKAEAAANIGVKDISGSNIGKLNLETDSNENIIKAELTSSTDNNNLKIKLKESNGELNFNKNDKVVIESNENFKKIQMPKNALLKLSFNISPKIFGVFKAKSNNSFFQELGNNRYKIKNGIFEYNNGYIEELSNCKDCEFTLSYITGIICLYMSNSSLYNYRKDNNSDFALLFFAFFLFLFLPRRQAASRDL